MTKFNGWYFFPILLKIKIQVLNRHISEICTIDLQNSNFLSQNRRRSYPCNRGTLLTAASPPAHNFHHFNNRFFPLENPVYYIMIYVNKKRKKNHYSRRGSDKFMSSITFGNWIILPNTEICYNYPKYTLKKSRFWCAVYMHGIERGILFGKFYRRFFY